MYKLMEVEFEKVKDLAFVSMNSTQDFYYVKYNFVIYTSKVIFFFFN